MPNTAYIALIPLLPLATFAVLGIFGQKYLKSWSGILGTGSILASAALSLWVAYAYFFLEGKTGGVYHSIVAFRYAWLSFYPGMSIDLSVILDPISVMMIVVISFVSLMVHVYSLGYMKGETRYATYFSFLSLFTFSMLGLVLSENLLETYIFWELVGCSSYLLIGYYYDKPSAVAAAKKAFIVTRFADLGFLIGILILSFQAGSLDFGVLMQRLTTPGLAMPAFLGVSVLTWGLALVFMGGAGKSAMFPLHIWLPDAMEGPTPVSALIHAATMVVAGVYLVARLFPVFALSGSGALHLVMYVGAISAMLAAIIACTQTDIKRILAYSTMSQIGYMMFALGVAGYGGAAGLGFSASMFHLFTHAFFKALLFLCAGVVIHRVHSNEMGVMGGLRKLMPVTHVCFLVACLAISGVPPFSGFFSKEEIMLAAYHSNKLIYGIALFTSGLTAFYMFRLYFSVFWKRPAAVHGGSDHGTPVTMTLPLILLAVGATLAGFVPFSSLVTPDGKPLESQGALVFSVAPVFVTLCGILIAGRLYVKENDRADRVAAWLGGLYRTIYHKFYIDELYLFVTKKIIFNLVGRPAAWIDRHIVDGLMNALAGITAATSVAIKRVQSGRVQDYMLYFFLGIAGLGVLFLYLNA